MSRLSVGAGPGCVKARRGGFVTPLPMLTRRPCESPPPERLPGRAAASPTGRRSIPRKRSARREPERVSGAPRRRRPPPRRLAVPARLRRPSSSCRPNPISRCCNRSRARTIPSGGTSCSARAPEPSGRSAATAARWTPGSASISTSVTGSAATSCSACGASSTSTPPPPAAGIARARASLVARWSLPHRARHALRSVG